MRERWNSGWPWHGVSFVERGRKSRSADWLSALVGMTVSSCRKIRLPRVNAEDGNAIKERRLVPFAL